MGDEKKVCLVIGQATFLLWDEDDDDGDGSCVDLKWLAFTHYTQ